MSKVTEQDRSFGKYLKALIVGRTGKRLGPDGIRYAFSRHAHRLPPSVTHRWHPHLMRHSYGTAIYRRTRDLRATQRLMGHEHIQTTSRYENSDDDYLHNQYMLGHPWAATD